MLDTPSPISEKQLQELMIDLRDRKKN